MTASEMYYAAWPRPTTLPEMEALTAHLPKEVQGQYNTAIYWLMVKNAPKKINVQQPQLPLYTQK